MNKSYLSCDAYDSGENHDRSAAEMAATIRSAVDTGDYASTSEVVRDALRDWDQRRQFQQSGIAHLRELWQEARADKSEGLNPDEVFDELQRKYQSLANARQPIR